MNPLVSIIINCYNQGKYLERSVKSVLSQTFTNIECLIVDDGSTDNTRQVAENLISQDQRVRYFFKENSGLPSSRNFAIEKAQGEWIQFLDSDDWIHQDKIRFQLTYLPTNNNHQNIVFYSDYQRVFINEQDQIFESQDHIIGSLTTAELIERLLIPDFLTKSPHPCLQQAMLMHKSICNTTKFPEHLKALGDRYFALDILKSGANFIYTPIVGAYYTKHQTNRTNNWIYMIGYYTAFYENVTHTYPELNKNCQTGIEFLLEESIKDKDENMFNKLVEIVPLPVHLFDYKLKINNRLSIKILKILRGLMPNFVLYQKYRGPRSQKILSLLSGKSNS